MIRRAAGALAVLLWGGLLWSGALPPAWAGDSEKHRLESQTVLDTATTVLGEAVPYPAGNVHFKSLVVTLQPGQETGWHRHGAATYGYMLEGQIEVDYDGHGTRTFGAGQALFETSATWHNGKNTSDAPARILVVYLSDGETPLTEFRDR